MASNNDFLFGFVAWSLEKLFVLIGNNTLIVIP